MNNIRKQIEVTKKTRQEIKAAFGCSDMAVWRALNYVLDTDLSRRIRKFALMKGGNIMFLTPAAETIHDADGFMRQYFNNGTMIEADKNTGTVELIDGSGRVVEHIEHCSIPELYEVQKIARTF